jgi:glycosyltransferase involved in cell wall biosynthesis
MAIPRILFLTCMPLEKPRSASMAFMGVLLDKYPDSFNWFSLRSKTPGLESPFTIPSAHFEHFRRPARSQILKQCLNLGPWAWYMGHKAADFGRIQKVDIVLTDLAFEAVVAGRVASQVLKVPLLVSVHDDPVNRIQVKGTPTWLVKLFDAEVAKTMKASVGCGVICNYMGEAYRKRYGVKTTTLYTGVEKHKCLESKPLNRNKIQYVIGSIGSVHSADNWNLLIEALRILNQKYGAGKFRILHIGQLPDGLQVTHEVEVTGWLPEKEYLNQLAKFDVGFLNWSFAPEYAVTCRSSFPLKTHSYIQAQIPMLALGPSDSSSVRFVKEYQCGVACVEADAEILSDRFEQLFFSPNTYEKAQTCAKQLAQVFSREQFFETFESFVRVD